VSECIEMSVVALYIFDLALVKLSLGAIFLVWVLVHKLHNSKNQARDWREHFIWVSLGMFALAVDCDARFLFGWHALSALRPEHMGANLFFLSVTFALALAGKGHGRDLLACFVLRTP
jgi:hypothetical protein